MKREFKVGDRVAMYGGVNGRVVGTIMSAVFPDALTVVTDNDKYYKAHSKQCRLLKKKKPKLEVWCVTEFGEPAAVYLNKNSAQYLASLGKGRKVVRFVKAKNQDNE